MCFVDRNPSITAARLQEPGFNASHQGHAVIEKLCKGVQSRSQVLIQRSGFLQNVLKFNIRDTFIGVHDSDEDAHKSKSEDVQQASHLRAI